MKINDKILFSAFIGAAFFVSGCCCITGKCDNKAVQTKEINTRQVQKEDVKLLLPEKIYAVPGVETNLYFANVVRVINPDNYVFEAQCKKGRCDEKRWSFTPDDKDVGSHRLTITVIGNQGVLARKTLRVEVSPRNAGDGKSKSIMLVGDSLTAGTAYPIRINNLFLTPGNPKIKMVGSHSGAGRITRPDGVIHEGYGGWTWKSFSTKWTDDAKFSKLTKSIDILYARSPFLVKKDGKLEYDLNGYFNRRNGGKAPDIITFQLGVNDVFSATDSNIEERVATILQNMDKLLSEMRKAAPDAVIGVGLPTEGAASQDAFGKNYGSRHFRWQYKKNQHRLVEAMMQKFAKSNPYNVQIIPTYLNLDCENNFPSVIAPVNAGSKKTITRLNNGVHPSLDGYRQIGDTFYCWMKAVLAAQDKETAQK